VAAEAVRKQQEATLERELEECGESCPDKPEIDKLRRDTLEALEQKKREADDAASFMAALGNEQALNAYISLCSVKKCEFRNEATVERDAFRRARENKAGAEAEEREFKSARGNISNLKKYVADCQVCAFAREAVQTINESVSKYENQFFSFSVCNNDPVAVDVAVVGREDPNLGMWIAKGWWTVEPGRCKEVGTSLETFEFNELKISEKEYTWRLDGKPWSFVAAAFSPFTSSWGWSGTGYSSRQEAERVALQECGKHAFDCRIGGWTRDDSCLAMATGDNSTGGTSIGISPSSPTWLDARREARNICRNYNGIGCRIVNESCKP
jgi:uncharacterized membrane protein